MEESGQYDAVSFSRSEDEKYSPLNNGNMLR